MRLQRARASDLLVRFRRIVCQYIPQRTQLRVDVLARLYQPRAHDAADFVQLHRVERRGDLLPEERVVLGERAQLGAGRLGARVGARRGGRARLAEHPPAVGLRLFHTPVL